MLRDYSAPPPAPTTPLATPATDDCTFILAGRDATADGSVLMGYNNDWATDNRQYLQLVPGDATHYRYVRLLTSGARPQVVPGDPTRYDCVESLTPGVVPEGGINEHHLGVLYGTVTTLDKSVLAADPYVDRGYGGQIWDTILQQCATARQALDLLQEMAQTGFTNVAAGSFAMADANEAWVFELLGGHHWVAARVPDNAYVAHPNTLVVQHVDLSNPADFRGSPDLMSFARSIGRYSPSDGRFNVAWAYADRSNLESYLNTNRMWGVVNRWSPSLGCVPAMPFASRPVFVAPEHSLTPQDIMAICRDHYEGTSLDQTQDYALMNPNGQTNRPICYMSTDYSAVWQLRGEMPDSIGGVMWVAAGRPDTSAYVPYYDCITSIPAAYLDRTAHLAFQGIATTLEQCDAAEDTTAYGAHIGLVRRTFGGFETMCRSAQEDCESTAARKTVADRVAYLTDYSAQRADEALNLAAGLCRRLAETMGDGADVRR